MTAIKQEYFKEAETLWDLERLLDDLATVKGEPLTIIEQLFLRGLLCGYTPTGLAAVRVKGEAGERTGVSRGVYKYVKRLMKQKGMEVPERINSVKMLDLLKKTGYKKSHPAEVKPPITAKPLESLVKIVRNEVKGDNLESSIKVAGDKTNSGNNRINRMPVEVHIDHIENVRLVTALSSEELIKLLSGTSGKEEKEEE